MCRSTRSGRTVVVPGDAELRSRLIAEFHDSPWAGHLGAYRVIGAMSSRYYWRGMQADIRRYIRGCQTC